MTNIYKIFILCTALNMNVFGQNLNSLRTASLKIENNLLVQDSLTIVPSTVKIFTKIGNKKISEFSVSNNKIFLADSTYLANFGRDVHLSYRVFDFDIGKSYFHLDSTVMDTVNTNIYIGYQKTSVDDRLIDATNLDYNGSFSRGFSVGNAQSLVLNSNFNLQMSGDLGGGIKVAAAISDDNIPIQPEGNTKLLQEFDKVFIKVSKDQSSVLAGDFQLQRPKGYFTNYLKKLKGLSVENTSQLDNYTLSSNASVAVSRGKFARQTLPTTEGNQGPYKLVGTNGERFLIVLSGTEKIYLDGRLLERGFDYDYVIDYNRAEIIFTPKVLIKRESRIIAEFEFTDQSYLRTLYAVNSYMSHDKWDLNLSFYNEQDSKAATGDIVLDSIDLATLALSGDSIDQAVRPGIFSILDTNRVRGLVTYEQVANDSVDFILVYSDDRSRELVTASFTEVSSTAGSYIIDTESQANGRVYKYVGVGRGNYLPVVRLTAPEKKQLVSLGGEYRINDDLKFGSEISLSNNDINRLSQRDDEDNIGLAGMIRYDQSIQLSEKWKLLSNALYERLGNNYTPLNPYRNAEFNRDWNVPTIRSGSEDLAYGSIGVKHGDSLTLNYQIGHFSVGSEYDGLKHAVRGDNKTGFGLNTSLNASVLQSEGYSEKSRFSRILLESNQSLHKASNLSVGFVIDAEQNKISDLQDLDMLLSKSRGYELYKVYLQSARENLSYQVSYSKRTDRYADKFDLSPTVSINDYSANTTWNIRQGHNVSLLATYRDFEVTNPLLAPNLTNKKTLIGKVDHNFSIAKGLVIANTNYTVNSGQQPKVEFYYERVPVGQGDYIYTGNEDSTLVNLNFRYAPELGTGNYIRLSLVNGEFINTNSQIISHNLRITPSKYYRDKRASLNKWQRLWSRISTITTVRIDKQTMAEDAVGYLNFSRDSVGLVQYNGLLVNTLFVNKGKKAFDASLSQRNSSRIFTQISGLEIRTEDTYSINVRKSLWNSSDLLFEGSVGTSIYDSEQFDIRDYEIDFYEISPKLSIRPTDYLRIIFDYTYGVREQQIKEMEKATNSEIGVSINYRKPSLLTFTGSFSYVNVDYNSPNSPIEFDILRGLKDGRNFLWSTNITRRLNNSIDVSLVYEGRKNGIATAIHIARAQVKATF